MCLSARFSLPLRPTEQVSIPSDSPTGCRISKRIQGTSQRKLAFPSLAFTILSTSKSVFYGGKIGKEPAGLSPASLCNLG